VVTDGDAEGVGGVLVAVLDMADTQSGYAITVAGGTFEIAGLPEGGYRLRTTNELGLIDMMVGGASCSPEPCDIDTGTVFSITETDVSDVLIQLLTGTPISGSVTDVDGNDLPTGTAWLYSGSGEFIKSAAVNNGLFGFTGNADGTYFLKVSNSIGLVDQLYKGFSCPLGSCNVLDGTPIPVPEESGAVSNSLYYITPDAVDPPRGPRVSMSLATGYHISGSIRKQSDNKPVTFTRVYIFDMDGNIAGEATTDGLGNFESESGFPDGTYFAATSRAARPEDTAEEAIDAENGVGIGLVDQVYSGFTCDGVCAPSSIPAVGTPIVIDGATRSDIHFILGQAASVELQKLTNGIDADTANGGEAPEIAPGETVSWSYEVTNTGGVDLDTISVSDNQGITVSCPPDVTLTPDETMICTGSAPAVDLSTEPFTGVIGNCDGRPSSRLYQNVATVDARAPDDAPVSAEDTSHYCNPLEDEIFRSGFE
jgi:hypothetical protein